jgi:hypothetical protein
MADGVNIAAELRVIADNVYDHGFSFEEGYFGDAVRANVHSALIKIDAVLGTVLVGGGEIPVPDAVVIDTFVFGVCSAGAMYTQKVTAGQRADIFTFEEVTPESDL